MWIACLICLHVALFASLRAQHACQKPAACWHHLTGAEVQKFNVAVIPVGSVESHGPHLPLGTDILIAENVVRSATDGLSDVVILPPSSFGASFEHSSYPGTIPIHDTTLHNLWSEIAEGVFVAGLEKLLFVNGHGGQSPNAQITVRSIRFRHDKLAAVFDVQACLGEAFAVSNHTTEDNKKENEKSYGIHGGLIETAVMSYIFPSLVRNDKSQTFESSAMLNNPLQPHGRIVSYGWKSEDLNIHGVTGNASAATETLGQQLFDVCVERLRGLIINIANTNVEHLFHNSAKIS